jgi:very-short-patch-repair endonuclease
VIVLSRLRERRGPNREAIGEVRVSRPMRENAKLKEAKQLRRNETLAEAKLWEQLRNRQLEGFKFVRQAPVGPFIADFLNREHKLVVEVDGDTHATLEQLEYDRRRTRYSAKLGFRVIRFDNRDIMEAMDHTLSVIAGTLRAPH